MRNLLLLLILIAGGMAGYLIGSYRGKAAITALEQVIETNKRLIEEQKKTMDDLRLTLGNIARIHQEELDKTNQEYELKRDNWQRQISGLNQTIKEQKSKHAKLDAQLKNLIGQLNGATGARKEEIEREIAELNKELGALLQQIESNTCLTVLLPPIVHETLSLKIANTLGEKR